MANERQFASVEELKNLKENHDSLRDEVKSGFNAIGKTLHDIQASMSKSTRTNWGTVWGGLSVLVALTAALWCAGIAPIQTKIDDEHENSLLRQQNVELKFEMAATKNELKIGWLTDTVNLKQRYQDQLISVLWKQSFRAELPPLQPLSDGPPRD